MSERLPFELRPPLDPAGRLRLAVATPMPSDALAVLHAAPHLEVLHDATLLPAQRYASDHYGEQSFARTPEQEAAFDALLASADAVYGVPGEKPENLARIVAHENVRWVSTTAAGGGSLIGAARLDREVLNAVAFTTSAGVHARPLAEFALMGILSGFQRVPALRAEQAAHSWTERGPHATPLAGSTVLIVGLGSIGLELAELLHRLGARVIGTSRRAVEHSSVDLVIHPRELAEYAPQAQALVATLPGTELTRGLVSAEIMGALPAGATIVNVGRGTVIDEDAMTGLLASRHLGFAALDVFAVEPLPSKSALWELDNVLVSPHTATMNPHEDRLIAELLVENARRLLNGESLLNRVDTHEFY